MSALGSSSLPDRDAVFITVAALHLLVERRASLVLLEARLPEAAAGRSFIPGSVRVDFPREAAGEGGGTRGRLPLPAVAELQASARRWGVRRDSFVVVYGDRGPASRIWWLLRWGGFGAVRLLDGGIAAWERAGHPTTTTLPNPAPGNVGLSAGHLPVIDADAAAAWAREGVLLDARGEGAYRGEEARPTDLRAGHIPGAFSAPTDHNLDAEGRLFAPTVLEERFDSLGVRRGRRAIGVYCGGGVAACHQIAVLASLGIDAALFPGSWSAWNADAGRPVATGPQPG